MTLSTDCFDIPCPTPIGITDGNARTPGSGSHIYSRNPAWCRFLFRHSRCHNGARFELLVIEFYHPHIRVLAKGNFSFLWVNWTRFSKSNPK